MFHLFFQFCTWFPVKKEQRKKGLAMSNQINKNIKNKVNIVHLIFKTNNYDCKNINSRVLKVNAATTMSILPIMQEWQSFVG